MVNTALTLVGLRDSDSRNQPVAGSRDGDGDGLQGAVFLAAVAMTWLLAATKTVFHGSFQSSLGHGACRAQRIRYKTS